MKLTLLKRRLSSRVLAWLCTLLLLFSLAPLYVLSFYNHACYDDFGFSDTTRPAWTQSGNFFEVVRAAVDRAITTRDTWQGSYFATFLCALQPAVFGEGLYWVSTFVLLTFFLISLALFLRQTLMKVLGADVLTFWMAFCAVAFVMVQFVPDLSESFFWWNGGATYTIAWSMALLRITGWLAFLRAKNTGAKITLYIWLVFLSCLVGGANYTMPLLALLVDLLFVLYAFIRSRKHRLAQLGLLMVLAACFAFSASAPGNAVRAATLSGGLSAPKAILEALYFGLALMGSWFSLPLVVALAFVGWQLRDALSAAPYRYAHPMWITLLTICLFCAQLAPTLYTGNYLGDGRARDACFYTFVLVCLLNSLYWLGWYVRRTEYSLRAIGTRRKSGLRVGAFLAAMTLLVIGFVSYHPEGSVSYGPQNMAGGSALRSLLDGTAQRYDTAMDERDAVMNDSSQPDVVMKPIEDIPQAFMGDALTSDRLDYVLELYRDYYQKQSVTLDKEDEDP